MKLCSIKDNKTGKWFEWIGDTSYELGEKTPIFDLDKAQEIYKFLKSKYKYNISFYDGDEEVLHLTLPDPKPIPAYMKHSPLTYAEQCEVQKKKEEENGIESDGDMF